ncbi:MAG: peptidylprolyl isomerase [Candidatus Goldbacteria bacterium]|nr:peptidylprolyl isomerase [Candidatus Goldiibacteriota bacterium]
MMNTLRKNAKVILWIVIAAFVLTIFAVWGMKGVMFEKSENPDVIAKIGNETITYTELGKLWQNKLQDLYDKGIKVTDEKEKELKKELLNDLIEHRLKLKYAQQLGIITTDEEIAENIMSIPAFADKNGNFDKNLYQNILYNQRIQPYEFEQQQREYITLVKLQNQLLSSIKITNDELKTYFQKRQRTLNVKYVYFDYRNYLDELKIDVEKMKDYYAMHKNDYRKPEQIKASHILIIPDASPTSPTGLTDEQASKLAEEIYKKIKSGEDFSALAKKYSRDTGSKDKGGDLGWFKKGEMVPEFEKAAFALKTGQVSEPVKTQFGYHIIKCTGRQEAYEPTFEKEKDKVLKDLQKQYGMELMKKRADKMASEIKKPEDFEIAAKANTITVKTLNSITENAKLKEIESEDAKDALFDLNVNTVSKVFEGEHGYYIFKVTDEKNVKFDEKEFWKQKPELTEKLKEIKFKQVYEDLMNKLKKEAKVEIYEKNL